MQLTALIITYNEEKHISRCIESIYNLCDSILVIDSGSQDRTVEIAKSFGAKVFENPFVNHANQINFGIDAARGHGGWLFRIDADEVLLTDKEAITKMLRATSESVDGFLVRRRIHFMGRPMRWGGMDPIWQLRIWREGCGYCEQRWMDEHIVVNGGVQKSPLCIDDINLNPVQWWIAKHNSYASREVVDLLNLEYGFMPHETVADLRGGQQAGVKRWLKERVYARLPGGLRALAYFTYRYIVRLGFLDGKEGTAFHVLQGFWYRYLVDVKLHETRSYMAREGVDVVTAIRDVLGVDLEPKQKTTPSNVADLSTVSSSGG